MSLINKMLQDLDARQTTANEAAHLYTKPVARRDARIGLPLLVGAGIGAAVIAAACAYGWHYWQGKHQAVPVPRVAKVVALSPSAGAAGPAAQVSAATGAMTAVITTGPASQAVAVQRPPAPQPAAIPAPKVAAVTDKAEKAFPHAAAAPRREAAEVDRPASTPARSRDAKPETKPHIALHDAETKRIAAKLKESDEPAAASARGANGAAKPTGAGKEETATQKAEAAYRRALSSMQDGYVNEAIDGLEQALKANPQHEAARQTLVGLLIENGRTDEAVRQLQTGLTLDPRQPSMAMLLARLQIEHGGSGIETLMRSLPYVGSNGEYHAFLAGALQRQQRHREAAEQYQAALQAAPQNGVWWMGMGISLQAEKRNAEALDAFRKAKATGALTPELLAFVDNRIQQLGR